MTAVGKDRLWTVGYQILEGALGLSGPGAFEPMAYLAPLVLRAESSHCLAIGC